MRKSGVLAMRSYLEILGVTISFTNIRKQDVRERRFGRVRAEKKTEGKRRNKGTFGKWVFRKFSRK